MEEIDRNNVSNLLGHSKSHEHEFEQCGGVYFVFLRQEGFRQPPRKHFVIHGKSMDNPWMENPWKIHDGKTMEKQLKIHGKSYGNSMENPWEIHG